MATDILGMVTEALGTDVVHKISGSVGESQQNTQKALGAAVPAILAGMLGQASGGGSGLSSLIGLLTSGKIDMGLLTNLGSMLHGGSASHLMDLGRTVLTGALGDKVGHVENTIATQSGVQVSSASSLMSIAGPLVLAAIGKTLGASPSVGALTSLLTSQKASIMGALPGGLGSLLAAAPPAAAAAVAEPQSGGMGKMLGWLALAALVIGGILYMMNNGAKPVETAATKAVEVAKDTGSAVTDAAKSAMTALGEFFKRKLPNGVELNIPKLGIENRLVDFIEDASKPADKTTWFDFDRLLFDTGKATLQPSSQEQLDNIANILKAYPKIKVKIGGYTDNVGDKKMNMDLSTERAKNVMAELVKLGVDPTRMTSEGYGEDHPVAENTTEEGRAKNRRISLRVTEK
jgi:OmpA-OmpF porin, OOP family